MNTKLSDRRHIGIIGGGQLAKMLAVAAMKFGYKIVILEKNKDTPAAPLATTVLYGDWDDPNKLLELAKQVDVVTLENEFVAASSLQVLEDNGYRLFPSAKTIGLVQDKLIQKQTLATAGLPVVRFAEISSKAAISEQATKLGWPLVLKSRRNGYDGKGNATLYSAADIDSAWEKLNGDKQALYIENFCNFDCELAVMVTRSANGDMVHYPVVESIQQNHICHIVRAPAKINAAVVDKAIELARKTVLTIAGVGTIGIELFLNQDQQLVVNEIAPRVHNSGHYTIESCECSQFENHVRAILGLPLGSTQLIKPAAVMFNILAAQSATGIPRGFQEALAVAGAQVHIYGKTTASIGRKMGHITALGDTIETAESAAQQAVNYIQFKAEDKT